MIDAGPGVVSVVASRLLAVSQTLDAAALRRWCAGGLRVLHRHREEINRLNVYPVADADTGTNLLLTLTSAWEALPAPPDRPRAAGGPAPRRAHRRPTSR